jgi:hypothetical protein
MAINGRINVDVLFHDTDGTASLKVVSLEDSTEYTSGKVAIVTGTCGTTQVAITLNPSEYRDASGDLVSFVSPALPDRVAFQAFGGNVVLTNNDLYGELHSGDGSIAVCKWSGVASYVRNTGAPGSTSSYTIVFYGT